jgi:hypothetical protein
MVRLTVSITDTDIQDPYMNVSTKAAREITSGLSDESTDIVTLVIVRNTYTFQLSNRELLACPCRRHIASQVL